ncbi:Uncharacterized protein APZ42_006566, partial [Daphnia magna]
MNITILLRVFVYYVLLTISLHHPMYPDFKASLLSQPSSIHFNSSLWLLFLACQMQTGIKVHLHCHTMVFSFDWLSGFLIYTSNVIVNPAAKSSSHTSHAVLDSSWNFPATSTQVEKGILPVVWTKPASPSSPRRLRLAVFPSPSSPRRLPLAIFPSPSSPLRLRHAILAAPSSPRHPRLTVFARARLLLIAVIVERRVF